MVSALRTTTSKQSYDGIRTENDNVKTVIWWYPHWERQRQTVIWRYPHWEWQRQNRHMMVSALRTTTSKPSYDGIRTENDNVKTVIWRYPHWEQRQNSHMTVSAPRTTTSKQSYDGIRTENDNVKTVIWRYLHWERQRQNRHMMGPAWLGLMDISILQQILEQRHNI
jgi:hypothetical protein